MAGHRRLIRRRAGRQLGTPKKADLEALWKRNVELRKKALSNKLSPQEFQSLPPQLRLPVKLHGFERPQGLRGPALVQWVMLLGGIWRDKRFDDFINALLEHGIVKPYTHEFDPDRQGPELDMSNEFMRIKCLEEVRARYEQVGSWRRASEEIAAEWGLPGNSLGANSLDAVARGLRDQLRSPKKPSSDQLRSKK
jgi:hypothetical protein